MEQLWISTVPSLDLPEWWLQRAERFRKIY